jgi:hypothetical protein
VKTRIQDLRELVELYGIDGKARAELYVLVRQARERGWWHQFADVYPPESEILYGLEEAAATIRQHSPSLIPGLLQTQAYAEALVGAADCESAIKERRVELRMRRQQLLTRAKPCDLYVIVDEAALCRQVGGPNVMSEQLQFLLEASNQPNITVQVLQFSAGAHPAAGVPFTLFDFNLPGVGHIVFHEQLTGNSFIDEQAQTVPVVAAWEAASRIALPPDESRALISMCQREHSLTGTSRVLDVEGGSLPQPRPRRPAASLSFSSADSN